MNNKLHILITGENNETKSYVMSKHMIKSIAISSLLLFVVLIALSIAGVQYTSENIELKSTIQSLDKELHIAKSWNEEFSEKVSLQQAEKKIHLQNTLEELNEKSDEKEELLNNALTELKSRSQIIESILKTIGIKVDVKESTQNSGGPYIPLSDNSLDDLTFKVDHYLNKLNSIPLGAPSFGVITSRYGRRADPFNKKPSFHAGVDIRKETGARIVSTADGKVEDKGYTNGHGNFLLIDHKNGFKTRYFHMKKSIVNKGDNIKRGQQIGQVGNTGRSTGPHLHYEIIYNGRSIDPLKFIRIARHIK